MATDIIPPAHDLAILSRLVFPDDEQVALAAAEALLLLRFEQGDLDRIHELNLKNHEGRLVPGEQVELDDYCRANFLLDLIHSKARRTVKAARRSD